jgi:hypothetical protein
MSVQGIQEQMSEVFIHDESSDSMASVSPRAFAVSPEENSSSRKKSRGSVPMLEPSPSTDHATGSGQPGNMLTCTCSVANVIVICSSLPKLWIIVMLLASDLSTQ